MKCGYRIRRPILRLYASKGMCVMSNIVELNDSVAFHPGYYIKELMNDNELDVSSLADKLNVSTDVLTRLINGKQSISDSIASKLADEFGVSKTMWFNLQTAYDEKLRNNSVDFEME